MTFNSGNRESQKSSKSSTESITSHEHAQSPLKLISGIVLGQKIYATRDQARLKYTHKEATCIQGLFVMDNSFANREDSCFESEIRILLQIDWSIPSKKFSIPRITEGDVFFKSQLLGTSIVIRPMVTMTRATLKSLLCGFIPRFF